MKGPLAGVIGLVQSLAEADNLTAEQKEQIRMVEETALQVLDMINLSNELFNLFSSVGNVHKFVKTQSWQGFQTIRFKCATVADSLANPRIGAAYSEKPAIFLKHTLSETNEKAAKHQLVRMTANSDCSTEENRFKIETGRFTLNPQVVQVARVVRRIAELMRRAFAGKDLTIAVATPKGVDDDQFTAIGDPMLCYSLFQNLLKNACEAAPDWVPTRHDCLPKRKEGRSPWKPVTKPTRHASC